MRTFTWESDSRVREGGYRLRRGGQRKRLHVCTRHRQPFVCVSGSHGGALRYRRMGHEYGTVETILRQRIPNNERTRCRGREWVRCLITILTRRTNPRAALTFRRIRSV